MSRRLSSMEMEEARAAAKKAADGLRAYARAHEGQRPSLEDVERLMLALSVARFDLSLLGMGPMERIEARSRRAAKVNGAAAEGRAPSVPRNKPPPKLPALKLAAAPPDRAELWFEKM